MLDEYWQHTPGKQIQIVWILLEHIAEGRVINPFQQRAAEKNNLWRKEEHLPTDSCELGIIHAHEDLIYPQKQTNQIKNNGRHTKY